MLAALAELLLTCQVTAVFVVPETVAVSCCAWPVCTLSVAGVEGVNKCKWGDAGLSMHDRFWLLFWFARGVCRVLLPLVGCLLPPPLYLQLDLVSTRQ